MAKTLTMQLLITSSDLFDGNALKILQTDELSVDGDVTQGSIEVTADHVTFYTAGTDQAYMYFKNSSTTSDTSDPLELYVTIEGSDDALRLKAGEWAWMKLAEKDLSVKTAGAIAAEDSPLLDYLICVDSA